MSSAVSRCLLLLLPLLLLVLFPAVFAINGTAQAADAPLALIVSIPPQRYMLERIAGERVAVTVLLRPGADPHSYEPGPAEMRACSGARAWFTIGVPFEDVWLPRIQSASPGLAVVATIARIKRLRFTDDAALLADLPLAHDNGTKDAANPTAPAQPPLPKLAAEGKDEAGHEHGLGGGHGLGSGHQSGEDEAGHEHGQGHGQGHEHDHQPEEAEDPHVWLSPMLVRDMLPLMATELGKLLPEYAAEFRARAETFAAELEALDEKLAGRFADFPREKRVFLTFHPSFRYFAYTYGLVELAIEAKGKEPGPRSMKAVIDAAKRYGIRSVFVEPQFPKAAAEAIAAHINARVVEVDPLAENLLDSYTDLADKLIDAFQQQ